MTGRLQDRRLWLGGGAVIAVLILVVAWFGFINPQLTSTASLRDQTDSAQQQNNVLQSKNNKLKKENDDVATLRAGLAAALAALPSDGGLPAFTRQLSAQATANSVTLTSVIVGAVTPVAGAAGAAAPAAATDASSAAPAPAAAPAGVTPLASTSSLVQIPVSLVASGLGKNDIAFLKAIQVTGPRRALVTASQLAPSGGAATGIDGPCTLTLTLTVFSAPLTPDAQAALQKLLTGK
jgi:Tfp pilus assembly protein PilV